MQKIATDKKKETMIFARQLIQEKQTSKKNQTSMNKAKQKKKERKRNPKIQQPTRYIFLENIRAKVHNSFNQNKKNKKDPYKKK